MNPCDPFCLLIFMTFLSGTTAASLIVSPSQIAIGGSNPTSQLTVSCRPDAPAITQVFTIEIGKKSSTGSDQPIIRLTNTDTSVQVVDSSLQQRMTASGSISGATGSIQFILTDLRCADAVSTYYCRTLYLAGEAESDETTANITARSQQPPGETSTSKTPAACVQEDRDSCLGVGVAIGVNVMLVVDAICLGLAFVFRDKLADCISGEKNTGNAEMSVLSTIQAPATAVAPVGIQTPGGGDEYEVPVDRSHYDTLQSEAADVPNTYEKIRTYQNV